MVPEVSERPDYSLALMRKGSVRGSDPKNPTGAPEVAMQTDQRFRYCEVGSDFDGGRDACGKLPRQIQCPETQQGNKATKYNETACNDIDDSQSLFVEFVFVEMHRTRDEQEPET